MPKALANEKKAAEKEAARKLASNGVTKHKHVPGEAAPGVKAAWPGSTPPKSGVDTGRSGVVQSNVDSDTTKEKIMTMKQNKTVGPIVKATPGPAGSRTDPAKIAAKEEALAKMKAEKEAKTAKAAFDKEAAKAEKAKIAEKAKAEREAKNAAALEAKKKAAEGTERTYFGPMTALAERVKSGVYTKGMTGQLRSNDDLAIALDAVPTDNVIKLGLMVLGLTTNPYAALNRGQQSMNLRNKMRGAIKANEGAGLPVELGGDKWTVTLDYIKSVRDANNFATAEDAAAKRNEAKVAKAKAAADKKAADDAEKAKKAEALATARAADKKAKTPTATA